MGSRVLRRLALAVLVLGPFVASAQPQSTISLPSSAWSFLCAVGEAPCLKFQVGLAGGGMLSGRSAVPGLGMQGSVLLHLGERFDVGGRFLALTQAETRRQEGSYVIVGEALLRITLHQEGWQRLSLEFSGGLAEVNEPQVSSRLRPSGGLGLALELGEGDAGGFFNAGFHVAPGERFYGVPHAGLGFFF